MLGGQKGQTATGTRERERITVKTTTNTTVLWSLTATLAFSPPSPDGVTTTLTRQESIEKVRKRTRPIPSLAACALCPRASEAFLVSLCARVTQDQDKAKSDQVMMGLARLEFGWAECTDRTNFKPSLFHLHLTFGSVTYYACLALRFVHGSVTGEGTNWKTKLART